MGAGLAIAQKYINPKVRNKSEYEEMEDDEQSSSKQSVAESGKFPDTALIKKDPIFKSLRTKKISQTSTQAMADLIEQILNKMEFESVHLPAIGPKEKVYQFKLKYHDVITVLTSIAKVKGKNGKVFCRNTLRIGLRDKFGDWVTHSYFPKRASVSHRQGTVGEFIDALLKALGDIVWVMIEEYRAMDEDEEFQDVCMWHEKPDCADGCCS